MPKNMSQRQINMSQRQFVTFRIGRHFLGIDILAVREIYHVLDMTPVPLGPDYIRGLINLRGQILTVFDLGSLLGLGPLNLGPETHNVILKNEAAALLVDAICDVIGAEADEIEPPPANVGGIEGEYIGGVIKLDDELLVILSVDKLLDYRAEWAVAAGGCATGREVESQ